jgi:hypothetical protein
MSSIPSIRHADVGEDQVKVGRLDPLESISPTPGDLKFIPFPLQEAGEHRAHEGVAFDYENFWAPITSAAQSEGAPNFFVFSPVKSRFHSGKNWTMDHVHISIEPRLPPEPGKANGRLAPH